MDLEKEPKGREKECFDFLRESSKHAEEVGNFGTYNYCFETNLMYYSENLFKMIGIPVIQGGVNPGYFLQYVHPDDFEKASYINIEIYNSAHPSDYTYRYIKSNGEIMIVKNNSKIYFDSNGKKWLTGIIRDITIESIRQTELQNALASIKEKENVYHKMIEEVVDYAILFLDAEGNITNWNKGAERIKGYTSPEIIGKNFKIFYPEEDRKINLPQKFLAEAAEKGRATRQGWRLRKDGSKFWGNVVVTAIFDDEKKLIGFSKVTRDLTDKKLIKDRLKAHALDIEQKNRHLESMNRELQEFAYISSHDLQEPLRKIKTFSTFILEIDGQKISEKSKIYFDKISAAIDRMRTLINDLLEYAQTNAPERIFEVTDIDSIIKKVYTELQENFEAKHGRFHADKVGQLSVIPFQFKQLFFNLISNSLKFASPERPPEINIRVSNASSAEILDHKLNNELRYKKIVISDNGIGFDPVFKDKIFNLMQRLHGKNEFSGTGIGLAICKKIVENHQGTIYADSKPGEGASFTILIPA